MSICEIKYYRIIILKISLAAKHHKGQSKYSNMYQKTQMKLKISKKSPKMPKTKEKCTIIYVWICICGGGEGGNRV